MTLLLIADSSDPHAWCETAAQSAWPGGWAAAAAVLAGAAYWIAISRLGRGEKRPRIGLFAAGLTVWTLTLSGPLERMALNRLYSAYIFQQILLVMVVAPALLAGLEGWMLRPLFSVPAIRAVWRFLTRPGIAFLVFIAVFTVIHVPTVCNQLCHVHPFYLAVRLGLFFAAILLWWPLLSPLPEFPRLSQPLQGLYLLGLMLAMSAVAAPITFAETVLYHFYAGGTHPLGLSPLEDQQIGGLMMWVVQGLLLTVAATAIMVRWLAGDARDAHVRAA
jgi:putative membrane protein